eukprot:CAMPEP_0198252028 /NCGR_PEP_ID=MMETSP1447-20131203/2653_1 /TAXON_ID=420782 /ORGANISM="Chaetoceros dichaeta, Strain CCMP1751" /LENGTH=189 /DNA_ID=CAMNT_0043937173 /DNA_START=196 /DNA_END=765 /DNA_ORIENTATION=+
MTPTQERRQQKSTSNDLRKEEEEPSNDFRKEEEDTFGFFETNTKNMNETSTLKHQFAMHSALDRYEELVSPDPRRSTTSTTRISSVGPNSMWIGLLGSIGETKVYGYMTTTKIKFMASIEDSDDNGRKHFAREAGLKSMFGNMHKLYIEYRLNPFSITGTKISSRKFDDGITQLVNTFNKTYSKPSSLV